MSQFTQREFLFLDDLLHMEEMQALFAADMVAHCTDPQIKQLCADIARKSEQHFNTLLQQLDTQSPRSYQGTTTQSFQTTHTGYSYGQS